MMCLYVGLLTDIPNLIYNSSFAVSTTLHFASNQSPSPLPRSISTAVQVHKRNRVVNQCRR